MTEAHYNKCVELYADAVYRFVLKNLGHADDARDIVQSAFEKLWVCRNEVMEQTAKSYLFTIAYHQAIDHIRRSGKIVYRDTFHENESVASSPVYGSRSIIEKAFHRLNETHRSLILLKDYEGYSYAEIATITGLKENQVKVYLHRARKQMKDFLVKLENCL